MRNQVGKHIRVFLGQDPIQGAWRYTQELSHDDDDAVLGEEVVSGITHLVFDKGRRKQKTPWVERNRSAERGQSKDGNVPHFGKNGHRPFLVVFEMEMTRCGQTSTWPGGEEGEGEKKRLWLWG